MGTRRSAREDGGFTLSELLVVIAVLGILATITVFAVRGITAQSAETACATELKTLETAEEVHFTLTRSYGDEATLLSSGAITSASSMFDAVGDATTYTISVADGATCTTGASGGAGAAGGGGTSPPVPPTPPSPPAVSMGATESLHGVTAWRYPDGDQASAADQILVFGGAGGKAAWVAADDADIVTARRTHFIDLAGLTTGAIDNLLDRADTSGITSVMVFTDDDTGTLAGAGTSVAAYVQAEVGNYNATTFATAQFGGGQLASLLAST